MNGSIRIGLGEDLHRLKSGRELILGGVKIPYELGLDGIPMPTASCTP